MKDHELQALLDHKDPLVRKLTRNHKRLLCERANAVVDSISTALVKEWAVLAAPKLVEAAPYLDELEKLRASARWVASKLATLESILVRDHPKAGTADPWALVEAARATAATLRHALLEPRGDRPAPKKTKSPS